jgi:hypothetical protein
MKMGVQHLKDDYAGRDRTDEPAAPAAKKPYKAPSFRFESVFEVSALSCGKVASTEGSCGSNTKYS